MSLRGLLMNSGSYKTAVFFEEVSNLTSDSVRGRGCLVGSIIGNYEPVKNDTFVSKCLCICEGKKPVHSRYNHRKLWTLSFPSEKEAWFRTMIRTSNWQLEVLELIACSTRKLLAFVRYNKTWWLSSVGSKGLIFFNWELKDREINYWRNLWRRDVAI